MAITLCQPLRTPTKVDKRDTICTDIVPSRTDVYGIKMVVHRLECDATDVPQIKHASQGALGWVSLLFSSGTPQRRKF